MLSSIGIGLIDFMFTTQKKYIKHPKLELTQSRTHLVVWEKSKSLGFINENDLNENDRKNVKQRSQKYLSISLEILDVKWSAGFAWNSG